MMRAFCILFTMIIFVGTTEAATTTKKRLNKKRRFKRSSKNLRRFQNKKSVLKTRPLLLDIGVIQKDYKNQNELDTGLEDQKHMGLSVGMGYEFLDGNFISTTTKVKIEVAADAIGNDKSENSSAAYLVASYGVLATQSLNLNQKISTEFILQPFIEGGIGYGMYHQKIEGSLAGKDVSLESKGEAPIYSAGAGINFKLSRIAPYLKYQMQFMKINKFETTAKIGSESQTETIKNDKESETNYTNHTISTGIMIRF